MTIFYAHSIEFYNFIDLFVNLFLFEVFIAVLITSSARILQVLKDKYPHNGNREQIQLEEKVGSKQFSLWWRGLLRNTVVCKLKKVTKTDKNLKYISVFIKINMSILTSF